MKDKPLKIMLLGIVIILVGIYIGILGLGGVKTYGNELFLIITGAIVSIAGFFMDPKKRRG